MGPKVRGEGEGRPWKRRQFFTFQRERYATTIVYPRRNLRRLVGWILLFVLGIAGLYFLIWHKDPLPGNHEAIGLGNVHLVHAVIGIVLLAAAGFVWYIRRRQVPAASS